jgi:organic hydroperoxide reductase OsmC/OhrA
MIGMASHVAKIRWERGAAQFERGRYSRAHTWDFDGGIQVPASSSPHSVPLPYSVEAAVDPEEALVAALSSCHMLTFLFLAHHAGFVVNRYEDDAVGTLSEIAKRRFAVTQVVLRPKIEFEGQQPNAAELSELHHRAHEECYIANSVKTEVRVEPA